MSQPLNLLAFVEFEVRFTIILQGLGFQNLVNYEGLYPRIGAFLERNAIPHLLQTHFAICV